MEIPDFKNKWPVWREHIRKEYPDMTDDELQYHEGQEAELVLRLEQKMKKNKKEIYNWLHMMG